MNSRAVGNALISRFGGEWFKGDTEVRINCPFCHKRGQTRDTSMNLEINLVDKLIFSCWRCHYGGRSTTVVSLLLGKVLDVQSIEETDFDDVATAIADRLTKAHPAAPRSEPADMALLSGFYDILAADPTAEAPRRYMEGRGISREDMAWYRLKYGLTGYAAGRVIIPCFEKGRCVFWLGRTYVGGDPPYKNIPNRSALQPRKETVFNIDGVLSGQTAVVLEGALNAMVCGSNAVATMGKAMTDGQFWKILSRGPRNVVVGWDKDAEREGIAVAKRFHDAGLQTFLIFFKDGADFADLGRDVARRMVAEAEPFRIHHFVGRAR